MTAEWFSAGIQPGSGGYRKYEYLVRAWEPGDGMRCAAAPHNKRIVCGEPVAVVKSVRADDPRNLEPYSVTRVCCIRHLAARFGGDELSTSADPNVEKQSLEELAQNHWDEYQKIRDRRESELLNKRFSVLPDALREKVIAALSESCGEPQEASA